MWFCDFLIILIDGFINKTEKLKKKIQKFKKKTENSNNKKITCLILNYICHKAEMDMILYSDKQPHL